MRFVIVLGMAAGLLAFKYDWIRVFAAHPSPHTLPYPSPYPSPSVSPDGVRSVRWDGGAEPIMSAEAGTLEITDGATHTVVALDNHGCAAAQLATAGSARGWMCAWPFANALERALRTCAGSSGAARN